MSRPIPEPTSALLRRFFNKVTISPDCWQWKGAKQSRGYGSFGWGPRGESRSFLAHRLAWTWLVGPIPDGLTIDHVCRNKACVNVLHMELVDRETNTMRGGHWWFSHGAMERLEASGWKTASVPVREQPAWDQDLAEVIAHQRRLNAERAAS